MNERFNLSLGLALSVIAGCKSNDSTIANDGGDTGPVVGCPSNPDDLISAFDLTTGNGIAPVDGRQGGWYVYGDTLNTGTFDPPVTGGPYPIDMTVGNTGCSGVGSLRVKGTGWTEFGAAMGTDFKPRTAVDGGTSVKGTYNASKYRGVAFWAKAAAPVRFVQVKFLDPYTDRDSPLAPDLWCLYTAGSQYNCSPYLVKFGYGYAGDAATALAMDYPNYVNYKVDTTWRRFEVLFADTKQDRDNLGQQSPGNKLAVDQLMGMAIQVNADYTTMPKSANNFELWIDDVEFIR